MEMASSLRDLLLSNEDPWLPASLIVLKSGTDLRRELWELLGRIEKVTLRDLDSSIGVCCRESLLFFKIPGDFSSFFSGVTAGSNYATIC